MAIYLLRLKWPSFRRCANLMTHSSIKWTRTKRFRECWQRPSCELYLVVTAAAIPLAEWAQLLMFSVSADLIWRRSRKQTGHVIVSTLSWQRSHVVLYFCICVDYRTGSGSFETGFSRVEEFPKPKISSRLCLWSDWANLLERLKRV